MQIGDWRMENGLKTRKLEYNVQLNTLSGIIGVKSSQNVEYLVTKK